MAQDRIADALRALPLTDAQRADLWDAYMAAPTPDALTRTLTPLSVPQEAKATLWDLKAADTPSRPVAPTPIPEEAPGVLGAAWDGLKKFGVGGLELMGRPGEFVSGTVGGTLKTGSLGEGLKRGAAALLEPNLVDSQIRESMSKVIEEQAPEFATAHPLATAAAGFAGDVLTDPTNLLGGAGFLRKGGMAALKGLGASEAVAKNAMLVPVGEAWGGLVQRGGKAATKAVAAGALGEAFPSLRLRTLEAPGRTEATAGYKGLTGLQVEQTLGAKARAMEDNARARVEQIFKGLSSEDRQLIPWAMQYPESAQAAEVAANPRLQKAVDDLNGLYKETLAAEQAAGLQPLTRALDVGPDVERELAALSPADRALLERTLQQGGDLSDEAWAALGEPLREGRSTMVNTGETKLQQLARKLERTMTRTDEGLGQFFFADPATLRLGDNGQAIVAQATKNYSPVNIPQPPSGFGSTRARYTVKAAEAKSMTFKEAVEKLGAETDAAVLAQNRLLDSVRSRANTERMHTYIAEFGRPQPAAGYRTLSPQTLLGMPDELAETVKGQHLPVAIADELERYMRRVIDPNTENGLRGLFQRSTRLWKTMATSLGIPSFYANNFLGNNVNMYAAGNMSPAETVTGIWNSTRALAHSGPNPTTFLGPVTVGKATYATDAEIADLARQWGAIGGQAGSFGVEIGKKTPVGAATLLGAESGPLKVLNPDWQRYQQLRDINQRYIEDPAKLALFVHELRQGKSAEQASVTVRKVLFDYDELSEAERTARNYIPFYTWMRKNIPLQMATLVERPSKISHQGQFLNALREWTRLSGRDVVSMGELPQFLQTGEYTQIPLQGTEGSDATVRVRLPWFDVGAINPLAIPRTLGERLNPLIRVPISQMMGQDLITGQQLDRRMEKADFLGRLLPRELGGAVETERGLEQSARARQITGAIPIPFGAILRGLLPAAGDETVGKGREVLLRSLGLTPRVLTPEVLEQAYEELQRKAREEAANAKNALYYER